MYQVSSSLFWELNGNGKPYENFLEVNWMHFPKKAIFQHPKTHSLQKWTISHPIAALQSFYTRRALAYIHNSHFITHTTSTNVPLFGRLHTLTPQNLRLPFASTRFSFISFSTVDQARLTRFLCIPPASTHTKKKWTRQSQFYFRFFFLVNYCCFFHKSTKKKFLMWSVH